MNPYNSLFIIFLILIINSCANITPPAGGPKDEKPPFLKNSVPDSNAINYKGKEILLSFDERVELNNLNEQLIINPKPKGEFEAITKKNEVLIKFDTAFEENTTYNLSFREGIRDVTEKNVAQQLHLAFSTGPEIDSLKIKGIILDYEKNLPIENAIIGLYNYADTFTVLNSKPKYLTKSNKEGQFELYNIKEGQYRIYGLQDFNKTLIKDHHEEKIALLDEFELSRDTSLILEAVKTDLRKLKINESKPESPWIYNVEFNKGVVSERIRTINDDSIIYIKMENGRGFKLYNANSVNQEDSITIKITATDSIGKTINDTIKILYKSPKKEDKKKQVKTRIKIYPLDKYLEPNIDFPILEFANPIKTYDINKIKLKTDTIPINPNKIKYSWNNNQTTLSLTSKHKFNDSLVIMLEKGAFISMLNDTLDKRKVVFKLRNEANFATLEGSLDTIVKGNIVIELVNNKYQTVRKIQNNAQFKFTFLEPGDYFLRAYVDANNNNRWDAGSILEGINYEKLFYYKEKISIRANWEITDLKFEF